MELEISRITERTKESFKFLNTKNPRINTGNKYKKTGIEVVNQLLKI